MATSNNSRLPTEEGKQQELTEHTRKSNLENANADFGDGLEDRSDGIVAEKVGGVEDGKHQVNGNEDKENGKGKKKKKKEKEPEKPMVPFLRLFSMADKFDYTLMFFGTIGAIIHGAALPLFFLIFGKLLNRVGTDNNSGSQNTVGEMCWATSSLLAPFSNN